MTNDLKFSGEIPVVINRNGSSDDVFAPIRSSSCDINMVSAELLTDLYTAKKNDVRVKVERDNQLLWEGYMTPNTYSQELTQNLDEIAVTCIDPVSLLKYVHIDKIMSKPNVVTYKELIGKALAYVKLQSNSLYIEEVVEYQDNDFYNLLDMMVQVNNFWDEGDEPSTLYDMIGELLRPFGQCLVFTGDSYLIYDTTITNNHTSRPFRKYTIGSDGSLTDTHILQYRSPVKLDFDEDEWKPQNTSSTSVEINSTYDKVTGVASTSTPTYNSSASDEVSVDDRDKYDAGWLNVETNIVKGYKSNGVWDTNPYWHYIWNGVYINPEYALDVDGQVNGFSNINSAYKYLTGQSGNPSGEGNILNFYGSANNPTATGKEQQNEKTVEVKKRITAYAPDNGVTPEYLTSDDCKWNYVSHWDDEAGWDMPQLVHVAGPSNNGSVKNGVTPRIVYHQEYPNMTLAENSQETINLTISQAYSRTGINELIPTMVSSNVLNRYFEMHEETGDSQYWWAVLKDHPTLGGNDVSYFPTAWRADNISVNKTYWNRESTGYNSIRPVWDSRRIDMYVRMNDNTIYQFNGKEWIQDTQVRSENSFRLLKLLNGSKLFHNDMKYDVIECSDGQRYSLTDDSITYRTDSHGGVTEQGGTQHILTRYFDATQDWYKNISSCEEGRLSIFLPLGLQGTNISVIVDIWSSGILGVTGASTGIYAQDFGGMKIHYQVTGTGWYRDPETLDIITHDLSSPAWYGGVEQYGTLRSSDWRSSGLTILFVPLNATYVKAEHLELSVEVSVPQSNLGQMFGESDIKYTMDLKRDFLEQYEGPTFRVNTQHPLVKNSFSYLIFGNDFADPDKFTFNGLATRPETYVMQAYINYLSKIRQIYKRTLKAEDNLTNVMGYISTPEINTSSSYDRWLRVVGDSWDLQTDRHAIEAVEEYDMEVTEIDAYAVVEIPRKSRNALWNLPSVKK